MGEEFKGKGVNIALGPVVCIYRESLKTTRIITYEWV
jgi:hypothetical protein